MKRLVATLLPIVVLAGCAYYNGMYNANQLAHQAEKAEREGRTFDANSYWGQAGVKADTVLARHGKSKWADDALLIRGKAYQRLGDCPNAVSSLQRLLAISTDVVLIEEASLLLGRCYQDLNNPAEASAAFARLVNSRDPELRREALYQHGHSLLLGERYQQALEELAATDNPRAAAELAAALAGVGRTEEALRLADSLVVANDSAASWEILLSVLGRSDPLLASQLATRVVAIPRLNPELVASLLLEDGRRLVVNHPDLARERLLDALRLVPNSRSTSEIRFVLLRLRMAGVTSLDSLAGVAGGFADAMQSGGSTGIVIGRYDRAAALIQDLADSVSGGAGAPDIRLFLAGELARDSLEMTALAKELFARVARDYPESPFAPKALLALVGLDPALADSAGAVLQTRYAGSAYLLAWGGQPAPDFKTLEDSLATFTSHLRRPSQLNRPAPTKAQPTEGGVPVN